MDQSLVERMWEYLNAGLAMDVEALDALYDPDFENIRCDESGQVVTLTKDEFMARFRALRDQGQRVGETVDDVRFLATTVYGGQGTIVMHRLEEGVPARYNFVWQWEDGRWATLVREFTFERDITPLVQMVQAARGASA